jgi:Na+/H+ antiporter NhaD/arsenite permease-like protein
MVLGAALMVATFSISPRDAVASIDLEVIGFLFGMLVITAGFEKSGLIEYIVLWILKRSRRANHLLFAVIFGSGLLSAVLVNDTVALLWTPLVLGIGSRLAAREAKPMIMPLAFGVTVGSTITPIGNPQNLLVALDSQLSKPFSVYVVNLAVPTFASLAVLFLLCRLYFRRFYAELDKQPADSKLPEPASAITDRLLAKESALVLCLLLVSFASVEIYPALSSYYVNISTLALAFGMVLLAISPRRVMLLWGFGWGILAFFAGMFVVMRAVWQSGIGPRLLSILPSPGTSSRPQAVSSIMLASILLSQILSNVPFVQLYQYNLHTLGFGPQNTSAWLALAAGSTLAGNLSFLGAVSNVIIYDATETRGRKPFSFLEFSVLGSLVTLLTSLIFFLYLAYFPLL